MSENRILLASAAIGETRSALLEDGRPVELRLYRDGDGPFAGETLEARVTKIAPALDAAFLAADGAELLLPFRRAKAAAKPGAKPRAISDCVTEGRRLWVRVVREALPRDDKLAVVDVVEAAEGRDATGLAGAILAEARARGATTIITDARELWSALRDAAEGGEIEVTLAARRPDEAPLFERYGVEEALEEALAEHIALPSGGRIRIDETAALTAIDVDTGSAGAGGDAEATRLAINIEASVKIAKVLRFLDIGGLVVIDSIDLNRKADRRAMIEALDGALARDPARTDHTSVSRFGLVELSRERRGPSVRERMLGPDGNLSAESEGLRLLRRAEAVGRAPGGGALVLRAPAAVSAWLQRRADLIERLGAKTGRRVRFTDIAGAPCAALESGPGSTSKGGGR